MVDHKIRLIDQNRLGHSATFQNLLTITENSVDRVCFAHV